MYCRGNSSRLNVALDIMSSTADTDYRRRTKPTRGWDDFAREQDDKFAYYAKTAPVVKRRMTPEERVTRPQSSTRLTVEAVKASMVGVPRTLVDPESATILDHASAMRIFKSLDSRVGELLAAEFTIESGEAATIMQQASQLRTFSQRFDTRYSPLVLEDMFRVAVLAQQAVLASTKDGDTFWNLLRYKGQLQISLSQDEQPSSWFADVLAALPNLNRVDDLYIICKFSRSLSAAVSEYNADFTKENVVVPAVLKRVDQEIATIILMALLDSEIRKYVFEPSKMNDAQRQRAIELLTYFQFQALPEAEIAHDGVSATQTAQEILASLKKKSSSPAPETSRGGKVPR